jgi:hypothetical protein
MSITGRKVGAGWKAILEELSAAVEYATSQGIADTDTIRVILEHGRESPVALFCLGSRPLIERERRAAERRLKAACFPRPRPSTSSTSASSPAVSG